MIKKEKYEISDLVNVYLDFKSNSNIAKVNEYKNYLHQCFLKAFNINLDELKGDLSLLIEYEQVYNRLKDIITPTSGMQMCTIFYSTFEKSLPKVWKLTKQLEKLYVSQLIYLIELIYGKKEIYHYELEEAGYDDNIRYPDIDLEDLLD